MKIEYDLAKNAWNIKNRKLPFDRAAELDWDTAVIREDDREAYPERRYVALAFLVNRLHVLCFTPIENGIRVISFRKADKPERRDYETYYR